MPAGTLHHCSLNTRHVSLEAAIGSAAGFARCFLIEMPLPWSKNALDSKQVSSDIHEALAFFRAQRGDVTVTLLVPDPAYAVTGARLIDIRLDDGTVTSRDVIATNGDIAAAIRALASDDPLPEHIVVDSTPNRDLIVCTQGSRDACCATFGAPLYSYLRERADSIPGTRVWRSSHIGGHRFAPTMIDVAFGRSWGFVDNDTAERILSSTGEAADLREHLRGWVGYTDPALQMLEGEIFARVGWDWRAYRQFGEVLTRDEQGRSLLVQIRGHHETRPAVSWQGEIAWRQEYTTIASCNAEPVVYVRRELARCEQIES